MNTPSCPMQTWLAGPLSADVKTALTKLTRLEDARRIVVLPDVHLAREVCVGVVLATSRLLYPAAVGGDIGCGIAVMGFDAGADRLRDPNRAAALMEALAARVPVHKHRSRDRPLPDDVNATALQDGRLQALSRREGVVQFGTLGRGNHFLEFQADEENRLWLMVHSGSRAMGQAVRDAYVSRGQRVDGGLVALNAESDEGRAYLADMEWARHYARANRRAMAEAAADAARDVLGAEHLGATFFDADHNHVRQEIHDGDTFFVHRKGAASARAGEAGALPGSMGTESYHVEGRGCAASLESSSHGAGREMSRDQARRAVSSREAARQLEGVYYDRRRLDALREEAPSAYKDVRAVFRVQRDLIRCVRRLRPVLCYKGG